MQNAALSAKWRTRLNLYQSSSVGISSIFDLDVVPSREKYDNDNVEPDEDFEYEDDEE